MKFPLYLIIASLDLLFAKDVKVEIGKATVKGTVLNISSNQAVKDVEAFYLSYGYRKGRFGSTHYSPIDTTSKSEIDATKAEFKCPVIKSFKFEGENKILQTIVEAITADSAKENSLKCQNLYIYRPHEKKPSVVKKLPVFIYLHGGGNNWGSPNQGLNRGESLFYHKQAKDMIVVTMAYGLGPYGFWARLKKNDTEAIIEANPAITDVIAGLRWVQDHIEHFGGDSDDVTLGGHSAGATLAQAVHLALENWDSKLKFKKPPIHKLLLLSGSLSLFTPITLAEALERQKQLLKGTECANDQSTLEEQFSCLESKTDDEIVEAARENKAVWWSTVIDNHYIHGDFKESLDQGHFMKGVKVLITSTANDASLFTFVHKDVIEERGFKILDEWEHGHLVKDFEEHYKSENKYEAVTCLLTQCVFTHPAVEMAKAYRKVNISAFSHEFDINLAIKSGITSSVVDLSALNLLKTFHSLEVALAFNSPLGIKFLFKQWHAMDLQPVEFDKVMEPWFNFIKNQEFKVRDTSTQICDPVSKVCVTVLVQKLYSGKGSSNYNAIEMSKPNTSEGKSSVIKPKIVDRICEPNETKGNIEPVKKSIVTEEMLASYFGPMKK